MPDVHPIEAMYRESSDRLYAYAYRLVHDRELAADLLQDALERSLPRLMGYGHLPPVDPAMWLPYVFRAVHNLAVNALRRAREVATDPVELPAPAADDIAERLVLSDMVRSCMAELSEEESGALTLALEGFRHHEIAAVLGISPDAAYRRIKSAQRRLRVMWEGMDGDG